MGNACKKNVAEQVLEPTAKPPVPEPVVPSVDEDELRRLQELNDRLKKQKMDLEAELARWREQQKEKMDKVMEELAEVHQQTDQLLSGAAGEGADEMRERAAAELAGEFSEMDKAQVDLLHRRRAFLEKELSRLQGERERLGSVRSETLREVSTLDDLVKRVCGGDEAGEDASSLETTESMIKERTMARVASHYRPIAKPESCKSFVRQSRIDCAEFSSQTIRNSKALVHSCRGGDYSWYEEKPIRGAVCNALQCGEQPHDRWNCTLCSILDVTDAPLLL